MSYRGFTIVLAGVLVATCAGAQATAIVFDASSSATGGTWSHTVGSGADRILVVGFASEGSAMTVSSITYGGVGLEGADRRLGFIEPGGNMPSTVVDYRPDPAPGPLLPGLLPAPALALTARLGRSVTLPLIRQVGLEDLVQDVLVDDAVEKPFGESLSLPFRAVVLVVPCFEHALFPDQQIAVSGPRHPTLDE